MTTTEAVVAGSRGRRALRWGLVALLLLTVLLAVSLTWLMRSGGGRDFALARVLAALPPDSLSWTRAEGTLSGPLVLHHVRYVDDGLVVELERVEIDLAPAALTGRTLRIERLLLEGGRVQLPPGEEADAGWPRTLALPDHLPSLSLPLAIVVEEFTLRDVQVLQGELELVQLHRVEASGELGAGRIALERLEIDSSLGQLKANGAIDSASRWATRMQVSLQVAGATEPLPLELVVEGDVRDLRITLEGELPQPARLTLRVHGGLPNPAWELQVDAPGVEPARLGFDGDTMALALRGEGGLAHATLAGTLEFGARRFELLPSTLRYDDGVLELQPLALQLAPGRLDANGRVDLRGKAPELALDLAWSDVEIPAQTPEAALHSRGSARVVGPLADYALTLSSNLRRGSEEADVALQGRGDREHLALESLRITLPGGSLDADGELRWTPNPAWALDLRMQAFDPAWLFPEFPGAIDARLDSRGEVIDGRARGALKLDALGGTLRGRSLAGSGSATLEVDGSGQADLALGLGDSRLRGAGRWGDAIEATLQLEPLDLADLLPDHAGRVRGTISLGGSRAAPDLVAHLDGDALALPGISARRASVRARIDDGERGSVSVEAQDGALAGQTFASLSLSGEGTRATHEVELTLDAVADVHLTLGGGMVGEGWRGRVADLRFEPEARAAWTLREPAQLSFEPSSGELALSSTCLVAAAASLCAQVQWAAQRGDARFTLDALPLDTLDPFLADAIQMPASAYGLLSAQGEVTRGADGSLRGEASATSMEGGLRLEPESARELLVYRDLKLAIGLDDAQARLRATAQLAGEGTIEALVTLDAPQQPDGALRGRVDARLRDLAFLELFSDQVAGARGELDAGLELSGTRAQPRLLGDAQLRDFALELPAYGLALTQGTLSLRSRGESAADIKGSIRSGEGTLQIEGVLDASPEASERMQLTLLGDKFTAADIPELAATLSPDLQLTLVEQRLRVRGRVTVPRARINLERLQGATAPSSDVVIVDAESVAESGTTIDSDVEVVLGPDVRLNGFGLKGKLEGQLKVRDRPGRATVARGGLQVSGEYKAYGQDLVITRGRLSYASTPIDNPALDVRAEREIDEVTVGVQVRGTALAPELTLWSNPALDQAEQLSYLVLGRPLRSASQADGAQLSQAAAAFGGNLLAQRLGARMGLDEVGVADSRALGGAALTVGKFLSPKLYVSYGVALFGSGQVVTFKYLLSRVWSVQIDSGSENRAALNYRLER